MKTLNSTPGEDHQQLQKLTLSFWLGSSNVHYKICKHPNFNSEFKPYLHAIYFCFLLLDRNISLTNSNHKLKSHLQSCQVNLFTLWNNFESLPPSNAELMQSMQFILDQLDQNDSLTQDDLLFASNTKKQCLLELQRVAENDNQKNENIDSLVLSNQKVTNHYTNLLFNPIRMINVFSNSLVTKGPIPYYYFPTSFVEDSRYTINKMLLPAQDKILLEGLHVHKRGNKSKRIVLALVGHFQFEDNYLAASGISYADLFDSDVILINHRNFSTRAAIHAENFNDIVDDILTFVHHFKAHNKKIILYGMCGGSAHMLLAAKQLADQQIEFKLIVDRFFTRYDNFVDYKTFKRAGSFQDAGNKLIYSYYPLLCMLAVGNSIKNSIFYLANLNIHFGDVIRSLPEEKVLILQAKSHKDNKSEFPLSTDIIVHPDNDIRTATKTKRHEHKQILKELRKLSSDLIGFCTFPTGLKYSFEKLQDFFDQSIKLIDNEKMKHYQNVTVPTNLHSQKLYYLNTRHDLPMTQFIKGFFTHGPERWASAIAKIPFVEASEIQSALYSIYGETMALSKITPALSNSLESFLSLFMQHKNYLAYMGSRVFASNLGDVGVAINELIEHPVFKVISMQNQNKTANHPY